MTRFCCFAAAMLLLLDYLPARGAGAERLKVTPWHVNFDQAASLARKEDKVILAYFSGSDWDPWTEKLEKDVLNTELFRDWAKQNVILLQMDFPRGRHPSAIVKQQGEKLKARYSIGKVPTFLFLDPYGEPYARAGYDELKLHDEETRGEPKAAIAFLQQTLAKRPKIEPLITHGSFSQTYAYAKAHYATLVLLLTHGNVRLAMRQREELLKDQTFVKFVNRNVVFGQVEWPQDSDTSKDSQSFRDFAARHKLAPMPLQLIVWERPDEVKAKIYGLTPDRVDEIISKIQAQLPHIDYTSGWITDYNKARTIASQQNRYVFLAFTSSDSSEWSQKMDKEVFQSEQFKEYARRKLVLVRVDFPTATTLPAELAQQNKTLAEMFNVRGFPLVIVINPLGQRVVESKYLKGGPEVFLSELDPVIARDTMRRAALKD